MIFFPKAMTIFPRFLFSAAARIAFALVCCLAVWFSWKGLRADSLFRQDTAASLKAAIRLEPDGWPYYMRLAQLDRPHARGMLETALKLDRYNAQAAIELALEDESEGDYARAEKMLLAAFDADRTYVPRWSLANFYLRRGNLAAFWTWARKAAEMPTENMEPLFQLCWRVSPDPAIVAGKVLTGDPELVRQFLRFLIGNGQMDAAAAIAPRLVKAGNAEQDRPFLLDAVNRMVAANRGPGAAAVWNAMVEQGWAPRSEGLPDNGEFHRAPLPVAFDWSLPEYPGLHSWPGSSGLETEFTGEEPESCIVAEQYLTLGSGSYTLSYSYRTVGIGPDTGVRWEILDAGTGEAIAESEPLSSEKLSTPSWTFAIPAGVPLQRLRLDYRRTLGTARISGTLLVLSTRIQANPAR